MYGVKEAASRASSCAVRRGTSCERGWEMVMCVSTSDIGGWHFFSHRTVQA